MFLTQWRNFYEQVGLPSIARRFSGKPILVYGKESSVVKGEGFTELDLNAHAFSYIGRKVKLLKRCWNSRVCTHVRRAWLEGPSIFFYGHGRRGLIACPSQSENVNSTAVAVKR